MRKLMFIVMMMLASSACALELPDSLGEWHCVNEHVVSLVPDATSEDLGRMVYRDYEREVPRGRVQVILTEGTGTGSLYVPENLRDSGEFMPSDAGYKLLTVAGRKSILEVHAYMPLVLAVDVCDNVILTIESSSLTEEEIVRFAEEALSLWRNTDSDSSPAQSESPRTSSRHGSTITAALTSRTSSSPFTATTNYSHSSYFTHTAI